MSERREKIAKAIEEADRRFWQNRIQGEISYFTLLADTAIAAMQAEPTEAEAWQALVAFQNAACDAGYQAGVQGLSHWAELPDAVIGPLEHHLRTTYQTIHDAAIAAYESSVVFECDECGGRGKIVGRYDQDDAHAALGLPKGVTLEPLDDDEPTEAEVEAAAEQLWNRRHVSNIYRIDPSMAWEMANRPSAKIGWGTHVEEVREDARAALLAARKAGRGWDQ